jgi:hypothetical protein
LVSLEEGRSAEAPEEGAWYVHGGGVAGASDAFGLGLCIGAKIHSFIGWGSNVMMGPILLIILC